MDFSCTNGHLNLYPLFHSAVVSCPKLVVAHEMMGFLYFVHYIIYILTITNEQKFAEILEFFILTELFLGVPSTHSVHGWDERTTWDYRP